MTAQRQSKWIAVLSAMRPELRCWRGLNRCCPRFSQPARSGAGKFHIGDIFGSPGDSLEIVLDGDKAGLWTDRATGDGGDIFDLLARHTVGRRAR